MVQYRLQPDVAQRHREQVKLSGRTEKAKETRKNYMDDRGGKELASAALRLRMERPGARTIKSMETALQRMMHSSTYESQLLTTMGCSRADLVAHLESRFEPGMSWDNYGYRNGDYRSGWDVDHTIPKSWYDHSHPEDQKRCWNLANLRPMWHTANSKKGTRLDDAHSVPLEFWPVGWSGKLPEKQRPEM